MGCCALNSSVLVYILYVWSAAACLVVLVKTKQTRKNRGKIHVPRRGLSFSDLANADLDL